MHYLKQAVTDERSDANGAAVTGVVADLLGDVRDRGDAAVREYSKRFDRWSPTSFRLSPDEIRQAIDSLPKVILDDIRTVQAKVRQFARYQRDSLADFEVETSPGILLGQRNIPIEAVGAYVPGGRYPLLASAHMTVVTAAVAGVDRIVACTPPDRGAIPAATVAAMHLAGAHEIYILGGVQAIGAMALGTESIKAVNFLTGPGNAYVAEAKRQLFGTVGIDLIAGPTETLIVADEQTDPFVAAVDVLSQAEHGPDSPAVVITTSARVGESIMAHIDDLLPGMPTRDLAEKSWRSVGQVIVADDLDEAYRLADSFASEHVQILTADPRQALERMRNYGALFLGDQTCVSFGDKVIGTNHTLPTRGAATYTGGLWVGKFLKTVTYQEVVDPMVSAELGRLCGRASRVENFEGHARSGDVREARVSGQWPQWAVDAAPAVAAVEVPT